MPLNELHQCLAAIHEQLSLYFTADTVAAVDGILALATRNPDRLQPRSRPLPTRAGPPLAASLAAHPRPPTYFRMDTRLHCVEIAPGLLELLEVDRPKDLLGTRWEQFLDPDELKRLWERWLEAAQTKRGFIHYFTFRTPTGKALALREQVLPIRDQRTLQLTGWFGWVQSVAKVVPIDRHRGSDELSA